MTVVLDTNIFRASSQRSIDFSALSRLSSNGYIDLKIPYIIDREVITQKQSFIDQQLTELESSLANLSRNHDLFGNTSDQIYDVINSQILDQTRLLSNEVLSNWEEWKLSANADTIRLTNEEYETAMEAYFNGSEPFSQAKNRKDIPDALIYQQLATLAQQDEVVFVSKDNKLREAVSKLENVTVVKSLHDFLNSSVAIDYFSDITDQQLASNLDAVTTFLRNHLNHISSVIDSIGGEKVIHAPVGVQDSYSNDGEHHITSYGGIYDISVDLSNLNYYGDGEFELPVEFKIETSIEYFIDKSEYYSLHENDTPSVTDWNDYVYLAESEENVKVTGMLKLEASLESLSDIVVENNGVSIDEFDITLDSIDKIEVADELV